LGPLTKESGSRIVREKPRQPTERITTCEDGVGSIYCMNTFSLSLVPAFRPKQLPSMKSLNLCGFFVRRGFAKNIVSEPGTFLRPTQLNEYLQYGKFVQND
jgi:hypothetical protein